MITIFNNMDMDYEYFKEEYIENLKDNLEADEIIGEIDEDDVFEFMNNTYDLMYRDTMDDLDIEVDGDIVIIFELDLWNGRKYGCKYLGTRNLKDIFYNIVGDVQKLYTTRYDLEMLDAHHDGTNHYIFRKLKDGVNPQTLLDKIYSCKCTRKDITRYTTSLKKDIKKIYGVN